VITAGRRLHAFVRGRVQGVGFRATAMMEARSLGLGGWVRNRADGSVEVEAEGPAPALNLFAKFLGQGPRTGHVDVVEIDWIPSEGGPFPFETRSTL
jgi:acylphosphatase